MLAAEVGVDKTAVSAWERGIARPSLAHLPGVAKALGVTLAELTEGEPLFESLMEAA